MKTRIMHTKIWDDNFFSELDATNKLLFIYFLTNEHANLCGIYELTDKRILFETGVTSKQLQESKELFSEADKILFKDGWIKLVNSEKYNNYTSSEKTSKAYLKELELVPDSISEYFNSNRYPIDTLSESLDTVSGKTDTPRNKKTENRNKKTEIRKQKEEEAKEILKVWNEVKGTKYTSTKGFIENYISWSNEYTLDQIFEAIRNSVLDKDFLAKVTDVATFFRQKTTRGESVDYIGRCLNFDREEAEYVQEGFNGFISFVNKVASPKEFYPTPEAQELFESAVKQGITPSDFSYVVRTAYSDKRFRGENSQKRDYFRPETLLKISVIQDYLNRRKGGGDK
ncbi:MAG TPA: hypothetical protein VF941_16310 [Clostridia bacterium]